MADTTLKEGTRLDGLLNDHILYTDGGSEICGLAEHDAALIHDELRALRESHDAMETALRTLLSCEELEMQMYGSFPGGDPRCFTPDEEVNTPEELSAWKAACEAWDRGEGQDTGPQCQTMGDGSVVTGTGFGMGVTRWTHPAVEVARAALAKAEALHGKQVQCAACLANREAHDMSDAVLGGCEHG